MRTEPESLDPAQGNIHVAKGQCSTRHEHHLIVSGRFAEVPRIFSDNYITCAKRCNSNKQSKHAYSVPAASFAASIKSSPRYEEFMVILVFSLVH